MAIERIGLVVNGGKSAAVQFGREVIDWLKARGIEVRVHQSCASALDVADLSCEEDDMCDVQLLVTLGGDGTILAASHFAAPLSIPILGVHMGRFGFIAESSPSSLFADLERVLSGDMPVEERMMVEGSVVRNGETVFRAMGLNDIVINKGAMAHMLHLRTSFGGEELITYPADGVIVATPTGSSAYALSAGGPLVEPTVSALLVVPICAHTLAARPVVIPATETVSFAIESDGGEVLCIADSYRVFPLSTGDRVQVRRGPHPTRVVTFSGGSFYRKIHERLFWGERLNA